MNQLVKAIKENNLKKVKELISTVNINRTFKNNRDKEQTPLQYAVESGFTEIVKLLIENGADLNKSNNDGCTPLHLAATYGHLEVIKLLIENGADIHKSDNGGCTPLHIAATYGHLEVIKLLVYSGANVNYTNNRGKTALELASDQQIRNFLSSNKYWSPKIHHYFPKKIRIQIATMMMLAHKDCQISRLPKDVLLYTCGYMASLP
jgi:ankyrin repeat protein